MKPRLFCPGPTPVPSEALAASMETAVYHRTGAFYKDLLQCREMLGKLFNSPNLPLILTSSGTGALEAAMSNLTSPDDEAVVLVGGKFGQRWAELAKAFQLKSHVIEIPWGETVTDEVLENLKTTLEENPRVKAVFFHANETSTGVHYPVEKISATIKNHSQALSIVDAVSSVGAHPMEMKKWDIDCVVSGAQKGFGVPPGLSFIALSDKAWSSLSGRSRYYFDLQKERMSQETGATAWTPATTLVAALKQTLLKIDELGGPAAFTEHHALAASAVRKAALAVNLSLFPEADFSNAVTAMKVPEGLDGKKLVAILREKYHAIFAGGQAHLTGKIIRFGHLGFFDALDIIGGMGALELALKEMGHSFELGAGVATVVNEYGRSWSAS